MTTKPKCPILWPNSYTNTGQTFIRLCQIIRKVKSCEHCPIFPYHHKELTP